MALLSKKRKYESWVQYGFTIIKPNKQKRKTDKNVVANVLEDVLKHVAINQRKYKKCNSRWQKLYRKMFARERKRVMLWQKMFQKWRKEQKVHESLVRKILKNAILKSSRIVKRKEKQAGKKDFGTVVAAARGRKGDLRSKLSKSIMRLLGHRSAQHSPTMMAELKFLRGDLENKPIRELQCLYCGREAVEKDHYKSAVRHGRMNIYLDMPIGLVPSCLTCHRAGKDNCGSPESVLEWFFKKPTGKKNRNHPQLVMERMVASKECTEEYIMRVTERLVRFDEFHARHAPVLSPEDHHRISTSLEQILDRRFNDIQKDLEEWRATERMFN